MKKIDRFLYFLIIFSSFLNAGQYGPNILFQKPYDTHDYMGNFTGTFCAGKTDKSYDQAGQVVPFLQNYSKQDILLNFIDPTADIDIVEKIGTADFRGNLQFQSANLSYYKNIMHHMFLGIGTIIQNLNTEVTQSNIELTIPLTERQKQLLEVFEAKIPKNLNTSGILSAYLETGYNRKFENVGSLEFLQLYLKGALLTPQWAEGPQINILQYPFTGNLTFGYQVMGIITMNILKHMNFGIFVTTNSFQSTVLETADNANIINNQLLTNKKIIAHYTPGSIYNGAVYWELENFSRPFTCTVGLSFMHGTARKLKPITEVNYPSSSHPDVSFQVNATLQAWNITALFFEVDYNFLTEKNLEGPCLTLFFNTPLAGYHYPKINSIGGEFGLNFNYYF